MCTLRDGACGRDFLERVDALAFRVDSVHQMHLERLIVKEIWGQDLNGGQEIFLWEDWWAG